MKYSNQLLFLILISLAPVAWNAAAQSTSDIFRSTLSEADQKTPQVSTDELIKILAEKSAVVFDARPTKEFAISHIPGAINVSPRPGVPISAYVSDVAEIGRILKNDRATAIILYCNGPFCGKSKRLAAELLAAGFTNLRRYQLGIPVWRALVGVTQIEPEGVRYVFEKDRTAIFIDARRSADFRKETVSGTQNIPRDLLQPGKDVGEIRAAKDDGRLPMEDHNTRIIVFGSNGAEARTVAQAIAGEAFHNVAFFDGTFVDFRTAIRPVEQR